MPVSILERRRIEAAFAQAVFSELAAAIGETPARAVLARAIIRLAEQAGAAMAAETALPSLDHFASLLPRWQAEDALRMGGKRRKSQASGGLTLSGAAHR